MFQFIISLTLKINANKPVFLKMEFDSGNQTGPTGRAFDQQQIENLQEVTGCVSDLLV